jgi:hypothetical protein
MFIGDQSWYHGVKVTPRPKTVQALTLRVPIEDYNLLRAEAFVRDRSINDVVLSAIRNVIEGERREVLEQVLAQARSAGSVRGRGAQPPFKVHRKGSRGASSR